MMQDRRTLPISKAVYEYLDTSCGALKGTMRGNNPYRRTCLPDSDRAAEVAFELNFKDEAVQGILLFSISADGVFEHLQCVTKSASVPEQQSRD
jgi:hypothetical protein